MEFYVAFENPLASNATTAEGIGIEECMFGLNACVKSLAYLK